MTMTRRAVLGATAGSLLAAALPVTATAHRRTNGSDPRPLDRPSGPRAAHHRSRQRAR